MEKIWTYNLTDFTIECVEVDEITRNGQSAVRKKTKDVNTKYYVKFEFSKQEAVQKVIDFLSAEITLREKRILPLKAKLNELLDKQS